MSAVEDCRAGLISPEVALSRMLLGGADLASIRAALAGAGEGEAVGRMRALAERRGEALEALSREVAETVAEHDASGATPAEGVARIAAFFDRAVRHSPEASVALYSLGDPAILGAATEEIVGWLGAEGLLRPGGDMLDLGCGIGRVAAVLAPRCRSVLAVDVSEGMVGEARGRLAHLRNVTVRRTGGEDLDWVEPGSFDLVLAIDSFPYIVQAGAALRHVEGAARGLRAEGALCILNLSYRGNALMDRADARDWCAATGLRLVRDGGQPFRLWDASAFVLAR